MHRHGQTRGTGSAVLGFGFVDSILFVCFDDLAHEHLFDLSGFNDKGESIPFQGGTNQQVVIRMYKALQKCQMQNNLRVYWLVCTVDLGTYQCCILIDAMSQ